MNINESGIERDDCKGKYEYRVWWIEHHMVSTIVDANSPEEAVEKAKDEDSGYFIEVENVDAYGPVDPDSFKVEIFDQA